MVADGVQIILYRGKDLFRISNVNKEALYDAQTQKDIVEARNQFNAGECKTCATDDELNNFFDSL